MKLIIVAVVAGLAAVAAGGFAWHQQQAHLETRTALARAQAELQKSTADLKAAQDDLIALRRRFSEQEMALNQLQAEMVNARAFVDAERAISARLRGDLAKMKEEYATALRTGRSAQSRNAAPAAPMLIRQPQQPMVIRAVPGGASVQRANPPPTQ
jgi:septal ring factor EnvC (AmiA/AmiB activator)